MKHEIFRRVLRIVRWRGDPLAVMEQISPWSARSPPAVKA